jgi:dynactin complex subunit
VSGRNSAPLPHFVLLQGSKINGEAGVLRFVGLNHDKPTGKPRVGVELDNPVGSMDGTADGTHR